MLKARANVRTEMYPQCTPSAIEEDLEIASGLGGFDDAECVRVTTKQVARTQHGLQ